MTDNPLTEAQLEALADPEDAIERGLLNIVEYLEALGYIEGYDDGDMRVDWIRTAKGKEVLKEITNNDQ